MTNKNTDETPDSGQGAGGGGRQMEVQYILDFWPPFWSCILHTGCLKKMSFLGKTAITIFKIIQNVKVGGVLENSGYLLPDGH